MLEQTYTIDLATLLTLMGVGFLMGFMLGKNFMRLKMMIVFILVFVFGSLYYLQK